MLSKDKEIRIKSILSTEFPPEASSLKLFLYEVMPILDDVSICKDTGFAPMDPIFKIIITYRGKDFGVIIREKALTDATAVEGIARDLEIKIAEACKTELADSVSTRLKETAAAFYKSHRDEIANSLEIPMDAIKFDPISLSEIAKRDDESTRLFEKVKKRTFRTWRF